MVERFSLGKEAAGGVPWPIPQPVDSTSVARIGYDGAAMEIYVEFHIKPRFTARKLRPARALP